KEVDRVVGAVGALLLLVVVVIVVVGILIAPYMIPILAPGFTGYKRSEEHTSELQSLAYLVCRLLLEKKKWLNKLYEVRHSHRSDPSRACIRRLRLQRVHSLHANAINLRSVRSVHGRSDQ